MNTSFKEKVILILLSGATLLAVLNWSSIYGAIQQLLGSMNSLFYWSYFCLHPQCSHEKIRRSV